jgi:hypothetical protein
LKKLAGNIDKTQLKAFLRSKELRVVDDNSKDIPKSDLIDTLVVFSNTTIKGNKEYRKLRNSKKPNCDFSLLNVLFYNNFIELFYQTGATKSQKELDAQNGASEVTFWDRIAKPYNNPEY